ncbi:hypothetical protein [Streptomyces sp. NPDC012510]|uniref:hypothetical protein n=1 Tax=Streptomyces sp. NPDC012510 TaxID=3364838 RepID=UPI0036F113A6
MTNVAPSAPIVVDTGRSPASWQAARGTQQVLVVRVVPVVLVVPVVPERPLDGGQAAR